MTEGFANEDFGYDPAALAAAGVMVDCPGLPYPPVPAPRYRPIDAGGRSWGFRSAVLAACPGYFTGPRAMPWETWALWRDGTVWMSLVPMEVESQVPHIAAARGTVVVCGLGIGVMAYAVAARRAVDRVVVIDRDAEVIAMFHEFSGFADWPQREKIEIVQADARELRVDGVDFLYADIWPNYRMDCMIPDMQAIYRNIPAPACGYWGQEIDMVDHARARGVPPEAFSAEHVRAFARDHGLPLIGLEQPDYPGLCVRAATNPAIGRDRIPA